MSTTMKNLIVFYDEQKKLHTKLEDIPVLTAASLAPNEVLVKVNVAGSNPKDYKHPQPAYFNSRLNQGDDCAGSVAAVGSAVKGFQVGERVAGFHVMGTTNGTYAEYAICPAQTVFHLPDSISDEEAATMPLAIFTAAVGLYRNLQLPAPWDRSDDKAGRGKLPLVVNAASGAVGSFAIKLAKLNPKIGPVIAIAGSSKDYVRTLGVDAVVDYRSPTVIDDIKKAAGGLTINHVLDAANSAASVKYLTQVLAPKTGRYTSTLPVAPHPFYDPEGKMERDLKAIDVWYEQIWVGDVHEDKKPGGPLFGAVVSKAIEHALATHSLRGHRYELVEQGLDGVEAALLELRDRKWSGNAKFVTRIGDTPALGPKGVW
ncbi:hypothetical protein LTR36_008293 [Oleoguttula mirabilis]|uniref:Enoyl reductase (ER) domain-containing protein n=1 Tax=Oleoguttula mirabilis TaxID=1507867 RepID=A0AAV9J7M7_9PEZI|nr:hypothetical protein LTR36_008293 [Oleoguttula mirabilis]